MFKMRTIIVRSEGRKGKERGRREEGKGEGKRRKEEVGSWEVEGGVG